MRNLIVLIFCISAAAAIRLGYQRGKRYTYDYEALVVHGLPEAFGKDMALRIFTKAHLDYHDDGYVTLRFTNTAMQLLVGKLLKPDRLGSIKVEKEKEEAEVLAYVKKFIEMPVKFKFKGRKVEEEIMCEKTEPKWCLNIKRGAINHLYLPIRDNEAMFQAREDEVTVAGKCKTAYTITAQDPYYKIKRVIDLNQCSDRPDVLQHSLPNVDKFLRMRKGRSTAKTLPTFLRKAAYIDYDLQKEATGFLIARAVSESEYDFTAFGDYYRAGKAIGARTLQRFILREKNLPIPKDAKVIAEPITRRGLMFEFDDGMDVLVTTEAQKNILAKIVPLIDTLRQQVTTPTLTAEAARTFTILVSQLRRCTADSLKPIVEKCLKEKDIEMQKLLLDAVARVGTINAVVTIKALVEKGILKEHYQRILFGLGWVRNLNVLLMEKAVEICQHPNVAGKIHLQRTCLLSFGNLVNRLMMTVRRNPRLMQDTKVKSFIDVFTKTLLDGLASTDNEVKISFIKAIGNAGFIREDVFTTLVKCIKDETLPLHVRVQCVWALRHMARVRPILARQALLGILANPLCDPELRIACYKILYNSDPSLVTCQMIAGIIAREVAKSGPRSNQVVSFVASDIRSLLTLDRIDEVAAARARLILRFIPREIVFGLFAYSKAINIVIGNKVPALGIHINKINGIQSAIPRHLNAKVKLHLPGLSADFIEFGARMQGVHDMIQGQWQKDVLRPRRSIDILNYIFGHATRDEKVSEKLKPGAKLMPRFSNYLKIFGSEVHYGKLVEEDLKAVLEEGLFGEGKAVKGGITFTKQGISYEKTFTRAHLLSEARTFIPTLTGIPLKISSKIAAAMKGTLKVAVIGTPKLLTAAYENIKTEVKFLPDIAVHMHNKIGVWLPYSETGLIVRNLVLTTPRLNAVIDKTKKGYTFEFPVLPKDYKILHMTSVGEGLVRRQITPGDAKWQAVDLALLERGMVKIEKPGMCLGGRGLGVKMCLHGQYPDTGYLRIKALPAFPHILLSNLNLAIVNAEDAPTKFTSTYDIVTNDEKTYKGIGKIIGTGKTVNREVTFEPVCDKSAFTCNVHWNFRTTMCPAGCTAKTVLDLSTAKKIVIRNEHADFVYNCLVTFMNNDKEMRILSTWNKIPEGIAGVVRRYHPFVEFWDYVVFATDAAKERQKLCDVRVKLYNKYVADLFVTTPTVQLRRINQILPITLEKFPTTRRELKTLVRDGRYGTCIVKGGDYIKTTDNVEITARIPRSCPVILAQDARNPIKPLWKVMARVTKQGQHIVMIMIKDKLFTLNNNMKVFLDGQEVKIVKPIKLAGVLFEKCAEGLKVTADLGLICLFDGMTTKLIAMPWWRNRMHGACGTNDGEQWTDMVTPYNVFIPETMTREFVREWVVAGKTCQDKNCKREAVHVKLAEGAPAGHVCFTKGRFLRCWAKCEAVKKQTLERVAYHCLPAGSPLIEKIRQGDRTIDLANRPADKLGAVVEHTACRCQC